MAEKDTPIRMYMDDPTIVWRKGKPDYSKADQLYLQGRTKFHALDSVEKTVSDFVKTFEMEVRHKLRLEDFHTITPDFKMNVNGGRYFDVQEILARGSYNVFLSNTPLYDADKETNASSDQLFSGAFTEGFGWEVLEVINGPPKLVFTWRHWTRMTGPFRDHQPTGERLELFGSAVANMTTDNRLSCVNLFFDPSTMLTKLQGHCPILNN
ncbi:uncharacterized protein [Amphiura filiformis]|uniref:uncharacterized protein n=1 Tax=Amphiura filiformis TaxID=82378 RepID=UPI003B216E4E